MYYRQTRHSALVLSLSLLAAASAQSSDSIYLNIDNLEIKGQSTAKDHERWIALDSLQWSATNSSSYAVGDASARAGKASASDIFWSQGQEPSVSQLGKSMVTGKVRSTARYELLRSDQPSNTKPYLWLETEKPAISSLSFANTGVNASAAFSKITLGYDPSTPDKTLQPLVTTWDLEKNTINGPTSRAPTLPLNGTANAVQSIDGPTIYLRLGSGSSAIAGDSNAKGYENWIELNSAQWGASAEVSRSGGGLRPSRPSFSDMTWSLDAGATLPAMLGQLARGTVLPLATLEFVKGGRRAEAVTFMQVALGNVVFTGLSLASSGDAVAAVNASVTFASMQQTVWDFDEEGRRGSAYTFGYSAANGASGDDLQPVGRVAGFGIGDLAGGDGFLGAEIQLPGVAPLPVPEPQTWALMLAGIGALLGVARRRALA